MCRRLLLLAAVVMASRAAFSTSADSFLADLTACSSAARDAADCFTTLQSSVQTLQAYRRDLRDARLNLPTLSDDLSAADSMLAALPMVHMSAWQDEKTTLQVIHESVQAVRVLVEKALRDVSALDGKLRPYEAKVERLLTTIASGGNSPTMVKLRWSDAAACGPVPRTLASAGGMFSSSDQQPARTVSPATSKLKSTRGELDEDVSSPCSDVLVPENVLDWAAFPQKPAASLLQAARYMLNRPVCLSIRWPFTLASETQWEIAESMIPIGHLEMNKQYELGVFSAFPQHARALTKRSWCVSLQEVITMVNTITTIQSGRRFLSEAKKRMLKPASSVIHRIHRHG